MWFAFLEIQFVTADNRECATLLSLVVEASTVEEAQRQVREAYLTTFPGLQHTRGDFRWGIIYNHMDLWTQAHAQKVCDLHEDWRFRGLDTPAPDFGAELRKILPRDGLPWDVLRPAPAVLSSTTMSR